MKRWTENERVLLLALIQQGLKPKEIAEKMEGRTKSAVLNRIYNSKAAHVHYQSNKHKRDYIRAVRKVPTEKIPAKAPAPGPCPCPCPRAGKNHNAGRNRHCGNRKCGVFCCHIHACAGGFVVISGTVKHVQ